MWSHDSPDGNYQQIDSTITTGIFNGVCFDSEGEEYPLTVDYELEEYNGQSKLTVLGFTTDNKDLRAISDDIYHTVKLNGRFDEIELSIAKH